MQYMHLHFIITLHKIAQRVYEIDLPKIALYNKYYAENQIGGHTPIKGHHI